MEFFPYILSQSVHCWYIERLLIFCKSSLYLATLLKPFTVPKRFWVVFFWTLRYKIMSSVNKESLTTSLPICIKK
jgi:hypothetical protein